MAKMSRKVNKTGICKNEATFNFLIRGSPLAQHWLSILTDTTNGLEFLESNTLALGTITNTAISVIII